ncbi:MAG: DUF1298 domain-containing protein [Actinobacteria bacterium]|nr:DUF1298 domain-containing protein [Actinomycetota bacterium]
MRTVAVARPRSRASPGSRTRSRRRSSGSSRAATVPAMTPSMRSTAAMSASAAGTMMSGLDAAPVAPPSRLNGTMSPLRHLATHSRPMEDLKVIKRRFGTTVNDVLLAASAGALATLDEARDIKAMVPVSVEAPDERWGNRIAFVFLALPCSERDPVWRLRDVHVAMRSRKQAGVPEGADAVLGALALAPRPLRRAASRVIASPQLSNLTISNIPGPQFALYLLGCEVKHAYPVVPLTDRHRLSIGMTSIHERACFGVCAHAALAADADRIAAGIEAEIDELLVRAVA